MSLNSDNKTCSDTNECSPTVSQHTCTVNETCINIEITGKLNETAGFSCICKTGFQRDEITGKCLDINECLTECSGSGSVCKNFPGGYNCSCEKGFEWTGYNCSNSNECEWNANICGNGNCSDEMGSYSCKCEVGFYYSNGTCRDINECLEVNSISCSRPSQICENLLGSYKCSCNSSGGFDWYDFYTKQCQGMLTCAEFSTRV